MWRGKGIGVPVGNAGPVIAEIASNFVELVAVVRRGRYRLGQVGFWALAGQLRKERPASAISWGLGWGSGSPIPPGPWGFGDQSFGHVCCGGLVHPVKPDLAQSEVDQFAAVVEQVTDAGELHSVTAQAIPEDFRDPARG